MDGLLINTEDIYTEVTNAILREYGKPDLPWSVKAARIFQNWAQLPISHAEYLEKSAALHTERFANAQPLPGVVALLHSLANCSAPQVHIALATATSTANYHVKTGHLGHIFSTFRDERKVLGDDPRILAGRGKPAPDIFLLALKTINDGIRRDGVEPEIKPEECLVFEDSVAGVEAGRRAGMRVIWVPHPGLLGECVGQEEKILAGLTGKYRDIERAAGVEVGENTEEGDQSSLNCTGDSPRVTGDGWGELLLSLENFPYEHYGIKILDQQNPGQSS
ncbi:MAG: hypothetical protein M1839_005867 [Geoglossum umbratile]|nr:MAG: hypothetical protein M1839_005867 [Geoglossum umbratile]